MRSGEDKVYGERAVKVGKDLLGKFIVRKRGSKTLIGEITEVEVYVGPKDRAAHSFGGRITPRNSVMYMRGGTAYVYFIYGMHWQMNVIVGGKDEPWGVLLRALQTPPAGKVAVGPGKLARYLRLNKSFNGIDLVSSKKLWLEDRRVRIKKKSVVSAGRVGIDYAGTYWKNKRWRFYIKNSEHVSLKHQGVS
ncbi:MAG: DNA-3-methyladenine glycosylase [Patescibacteria group bacterium]|nr:DNA-3-methyladenine glycosylase [Patescibacteria group bacterium]